MIFVVVDSVNPVELLFVFSSLSNWREGDRDTSSSTPTNLPLMVGHRSTTTPSTSSPDENQVSEHKMATDHISDGAKSDSSLSESEMQKRRRCILPGRLVVQTHSWRTVQFGDPVLRISTTGTKGATIRLPPGYKFLTTGWCRL